jgi:hypothetical protein
MVQKKRQNVPIENDELAIDIVGALRYAKLPSFLDEGDLMCLKIQYRSVEQVLCPLRKRRKIDVRLTRQKTCGDTKLKE